jgi:hypothetical protein
MGPIFIQISRNDTCIEFHQDRTSADVNNKGQVSIRPFFAQNIFQKESHILNRHKILSKIKYFFCRKTTFILTCSFASVDRSFRIVTELKPSEETV